MPSALGMRYEQVLGRRVKIRYKDPNIRSQPGVVVWVIPPGGSVPGEMLTEWYPEGTTRAQIMASWVPREGEASLVLRFDDGTISIPLRVIYEDIEILDDAGSRKAPTVFERIAAGWMDTPDPSGEESEPRILCRLDVLYYGAAGRAIEVRFLDGTRACLGIPESEQPKVQAIMHKLLGV